MAPYGAQRVMKAESGSAEDLSATGEPPTMTVHSTDSASSRRVAGAAKPVRPWRPPGPTPCRRCGAELTDTPTWQRLRICPSCRYHGQLPARQRIDFCWTTGSFSESHQSPHIGRSAAVQRPGAVQRPARGGPRAKTGLERGRRRRDAAASTAASASSPSSTSSSWAAAWAPWSARRSRWRSSTPSTGAAVRQRRGQRRRAHAGGDAVAGPDGEDQLPLRPACTRPACRSSRS